MIGEDQRQRAGHEAGHAIRVHVHRVAEAEFGLLQQFAAIGIEHDVLGRAQERERGRGIDDPRDIVARRERAEPRDHHEQAELGDDHPAPAPTEHRNHVPIEQRRPEEFPGVGKLDQRERADRLQADALGAQPGRHEVQQDVQRQPRAEAREDADQHPPREQRRPDRGLGARHEVSVPARPPEGR